MVGTILKLSYNYIGETPVTGGVSVSFFFVKLNLAITTNHSLNKSDFKPNQGFSKCQFWLLYKEHIIELDMKSFREFPEVDLTAINVPRGQKYKRKFFKISDRPLNIGDEIRKGCYVFR